MAIFGIGKTLGSEGRRILKKLEPLVARVNALEPKISALSDEGLMKQTALLRTRLEEGELLDDLLPEAFATAREAAKRLLGERHYDVQILGGAVLHSRAIAEMRTGEGKTLVATLPAYLNALPGKGVHVVTVNDYLARRDAVWMGQIYSALGLSVGVIASDESYLYDASHKEGTAEDKERDQTGSFRVHYDFLKPCSRKEAYAADITYGTNNEFGFDYLRDNLERDPSGLRQRDPHFAIIDEIDSILIDEARTPLIISAATAESEDLYKTFARIAAALVPVTDYEVDEKQRAIALTDSGIEKTEKSLGIDNIYTDKGIKFVHHLETAVRARALFEKDKEYVVREGKVIIVDEFTGRLQSGRRWSEGLHQAIEAKEGVPIQRESRTFASITFQNYFRMYPKLAGMTGTGLTSEEEFHSVYGLDTVAVPTYRPIARKDHDDLIFKNEKGKFQALAKKVKGLHEKGQPVLIGTVSIEKNELLGQALSQFGVPHEILNAKNHEREGEIIAGAGKRGQVTLATNLAGRGVDIKLGGVSATKEEYEKVKALGGLFVIGTERHEARRIDNQLRGRSGRQGDPGETQFLVSLEDSLMRIFATGMIGNMMERLNIPDDEPIENSMITKALETAQKKIEGFHFDARKHVLSFDDVLNHQRSAIYGRRRKILVGSPHDIHGECLRAIGEDAVLAQLLESKRRELSEGAYTKAVRSLMLQSIDMLWVEHLEMMEYLRGSVNLRAYGQRDPLVEYRKEGLRLFRELEVSIDESIKKLVPAIGSGTFRESREQVRELHASTQGVIQTGKSQPVERKGDKIGRNDIVTITNGTETKQMKFKKAEQFLTEGWKIVN